MADFTLACFTKKGGGNERKKRTEQNASSTLPREVDMIHFVITPWQFLKKNRLCGFHKPRITGLGTLRGSHGNLCEAQVGVITTKGLFSREVTGKGRTNHHHCSPTGTEGNRARRGAGALAPKLLFRGTLEVGESASAIYTAQSGSHPLGQRPGESLRLN